MKSHILINGTANGTGVSNDNANSQLSRAILILISLVFTPAPNIFGFFLGLFNTNDPAASSNNYQPTSIVGNCF